MSGNWNIWIDTGGTFTDCIATDPRGKEIKLKVLSSSVIRGQVLQKLNTRTLAVKIHWPTDHNIFNGFTIRFLTPVPFCVLVTSADLDASTLTLDRHVMENLEGITFEISTNEEVPILATRLATGTPLNKSFPSITLKLGSTRGTNAILERKGARTALLVTKGFKDLLLIGTQQRADLFSLQIQKEKPLYQTVIEVDERIESDGNVLKAWTEEGWNVLIHQLKKNKIQSIGVALINSYINPKHELQLGLKLLNEGFEFVSLSHQLSNQIRILPRAETALTNAYLAPIINNYLGQIQHSLQNSDIKMMSSAGGLHSIQNFKPKDSLLSGPAGGVVGAATVALRSGISRIITFDMGGTSTDVSLYNERFDYRFESSVGSLKILSPSLAIETIASGGGSICDFIDSRLVVGPQSAGAFPGPACYGAGGPLTITDVNLLLGRLSTHLFAIPLYPEASRRALKRLIGKVEKASGKKINEENVLESLLQIANEKMAEAIKKVSISNGHNPHDYTLLSYGGAGGLHACALAKILSIQTILIPYNAGLLSAYGIGQARIESFEESYLLMDWNSVYHKFPLLFQQLISKAKLKLVSDGYSKNEINIDKQLLFLRCKGQESCLEVEYSPKENLKKVFAGKYEKLFGHKLPTDEIEVESIKVFVSFGKTQIEIPTVKKNIYKPDTDMSIPQYSNLGWGKIKVFQWETLKAGAEISGPAIVVSYHSSTLIEKGWKFSLDEHNSGLLHTMIKEEVIKNRHIKGASLELFSNRFTSVAMEMGAMLQRTSFSVNVKERLDFSCAVLDSGGYLVVNAPHIPVHLGSMGVCVREVKRFMKMEKGDVIITNHPAFGGSHLPDITLIKAVFHGKNLIGYVANRAHHAEIGGSKPGSMPSDASSLLQEGVIIQPNYLLKAGVPQWDQIEKIFTSGPYPTRLYHENKADLQGALASLMIGESGLLDLCRLYGLSQVVKHMRSLRVQAAQTLLDKLKEIKTNHFKAIEYLDDGSRIKIDIRKRNTITIDFSGTSPMHKGNLNATKAIVQSVVLYVLRVWVNKPISMNEGLLDPVRIILPSSLLNPDFTKLPAVVGGNTEVSQRLTDTLFKALGLAACSQGTMNNFLFGNSRFSYYETICGGTGAGKGFNGTDAVHSNMTNTRITDPEILEYRYPIRLNSFIIRKGSGGKGKWRGGNGVIREILFKETLEVNILSQHRNSGPYGLKGGSPGMPGTQVLVRANGKRVKLKGMDHAIVTSGDRIIISTPGGGGYGEQKGLR